MKEGMKKEGEERKKQRKKDMEKRERIEVEKKAGLLAMEKQHT